MVKKIEKVQCIVVGAGVVGLACAKRMSALGLETLVIEREQQFGSGSNHCLNSRLLSFFCDRIRIFHFEQEFRAGILKLFMPGYIIQLIV